MKNVPGALEPISSKAPGTREPIPICNQILASESSQLIQSIELSTSPDKRGMKFNRSLGEKLVFARMGAGTKMVGQD